MSKLRQYSVEALLDLHVKNVFCTNLFVLKKLLYFIISIKMSLSFPHSWNNLMKKENTKCTKK